MTPVIIHIGHPKAASTSIQSALWAHRDTLAAAGIDFRPANGRQHSAEVYDLYCRLGRMSAAAAPTRLVGGWDALRRRTQSAGRHIVSEEVLSLCDSQLARRVVEDLSPSSRPRVVVCVRRPSTALASAYSQQARMAYTVGFETWARVLLHRGEAQEVPQLRNPEVVSLWEPLAEVVLVDVDVSGAADLDQRVIDGFGLTDLDLPRPFLQRRNVSPSAASVAAWQRVLRGRPVPLSFSRMPVLPPTRGDGKYALVPEVADLVDRAFPTRSGDHAACARARRELTVRLADTSPVTTVGVALDEFEQSVEAYVTEFRRALACES